MTDGLRTQSVSSPHGPTSALAEMDSKKPYLGPKKTRLSVFCLARLGPMDTETTISMHNLFRPVTAQIGGC